MQHVRIRLLWHAQAQFAGYLVAQHDGIAASRGIELACVPIDFSVGAVDALLAGDCEFAVASPAHLLESAAPEKLALLAVIQQKSSLVYPARRADGIANPADLVGKRVAVWPGHENLEFRWMLHRLEIDATALAFMPVSDTVEALFSGNASCAQMTSYHELHELEARANDLDPYVVFRAETVGAALIKDGLIARRDWIEAHPIVTQHVIDSILAGWTRAFRDPTEAIAICSKLRVDMTAAQHARQLHDIRALALSGATLSHGLGFPESQHMLDAQTALADTERRAASDDIRTLVDERFWRAAPIEFRSTRWE